VGVARADVARPEETACNARAAGDDCSYDGSEYGKGTVDGACTDDTCTRLDYSQADAGVPTSVTYDCLLCMDDGLEDEAASEGCATSGKSSSEAGLIGFALLAGVLGLAWAKGRRK
jgi:hypothetical protein